MSHGRLIRTPSGAGVMTLVNPTASRRTSTGPPVKDRIDMTKLTWKIAVAGGAVAGISVGGFAIAQADDRATAVDPVDSDAVAQASPADPMLSPASTTI